MSSRTNQGAPAVTAEPQLAGPLPLGAIYTPTGTVFRVFAPLAGAVKVVLFDAAEGEHGRREHPLEPLVGGIWEGRIAGDLEGKFYLLRFEGHPGLADCEAVDIHAINTVNSTSRARITDLRKTDPPGWERWKTGPVVESPADAVIYELHVRDLTMAPSSGVANKGKYLGWVEAGTRLPDDRTIATALDHIVELGVTHVQLLPVQDFELDEAAAPYFWGYMTNAFNSPEGMYASHIADESRIRELKQLIAALHERGIGVILDVVYNHVGSGATFEHHAPGYYFRRFPDGKPSNGSGVGNDFRTEAPMARRFIIDSLRFWVEEYGVDGFRFDLMALIDLETMLEAEAELRRIRPDILLYGEPWSAGDSPIQGRWTNKEALKESVQLGAFNDDFRNAIKGAPDGPDPGFIQSGYFRDAVIEGLLGTPAWAPTPAQTINYLTCHDNLVFWDKLAESSPDLDEDERIRVMKLGYFILLMAQGVPLIHGGDDFARTKFGDHNSYISPDEINQIDWNLKKRHGALFSYVRDLVATRKQHPLFRLRTPDDVQRRIAFYHHRWIDTIAFTIDGDGIPGEAWRRALVIVNGSPDSHAAFQLPYGRWQRACDVRGCIVHSKAWEGEIQVPRRSGMLFFQAH